MHENDRKRKAFGLSVTIHFLLFLLAASMGLFSAAEPSGQRAPIEVVFYDSGSSAGTADMGEDAAPAAIAASVPDDIVLRDPTQPQAEETENKTRPQQNAVHTAQPGQGKAAATGSAGTGTGTGGRGNSAGTGSGTQGNGAGSGSVPAPPRERVEASLRAEATPVYPQELIDDDAEGTVTIKILVAADGSVEDVSVMSSSGFRAMDRAAVAAGWRFQFNPGDHGRRGVWTKTFRFQLN